MVNRNMMLDEDFEDGFDESAAAEDYAPEPDDSDDIIDNIQQGELEVGNTPFWCDPFNCHDPQQLELDDDEYAKVLEEIGEDGELSEDVEFSAEVEVSEDTQNRLFDILSSCRDVLEALGEGLNEVKESDEFTEDTVIKEPKPITPQKSITDVIASAPRRKYTNKATFERATFGQIEDADPPMLPKLIASGVITLITATVFGVMANSYYIANKDTETDLNTFQCAFKWLGNTPPISLSPIYADVFFMAFGVIAAVLAAIFLLIWDNSSQKKARREGKEHGNARFATMSDYKKYRQRHMDTKR